MKRAVWCLLEIQHWEGGISVYDTKMRQVIDLTYELRRSKISALESNQKILLKHIPCGPVEITFPIAYYRNCDVCRYGGKDRRCCEHGSPPRVQRPLPVEYVLEYGQERDEGI